jgi:hypothetical protein
MAVEFLVQLFFLPGLALSAHRPRRFLGKARYLSATGCLGLVGYEELNWIRGRMRWQP